MTVIGYFCLLSQSYISVNKAILPKCKCSLICLLSVASLKLNKHQTLFLSYTEQFQLLLSCSRILESSVKVFDWNRSKASLCELMRLNELQQVSWFSFNYRRSISNFPLSWVIADLNQESRGNCFNHGNILVVTETLSGVKLWKVVFRIGGSFAFIDLQQLNDDACSSITAFAHLACSFPNSIVKRKLHDPCYEIAL